MILVTGAAGFIGSRIIRGLNQHGRYDILAVDDLSDGHRFVNLVDLTIHDYWDKDRLRQYLEAGATFPKSIEAVFHQGACSATTEWDGRFMMANNYDYSKLLWRYCTEREIPLIYASSAAVYGGECMFREEPACEKPLNVYGYSKLLFDQWVRRHPPSSQVVGLRYFNVYGPGEQHKGSMASVAWHLQQQLKMGDSITLFAGCDGYADGEQRRDFVYIDDVVAVNLWFWEHPQHSGIFNVGTGASEPFNAIAAAVLRAHGRGTLNYVPFPDHLRGAYQSFTEADITALRAIGYAQPFKDVATGVAAYCQAMSLRGA